MSWARLLKRVFDIDVEHCAHCGGDLKIIAAPSTGSGQALRHAQDRPFDRLRTGIEEPAVIVRMLTHMGLPARAPPRAPARADAGHEESTRAGKFSKTVRLTVCRAGDLVADSEKVD